MTTFTKLRRFTCHRFAGLAFSVLAAGSLVTAAHADAYEPHKVTTITNVAYGSALPGNLLNLHLPETRGNAKLPLVIWNAGSGWQSNSSKDAEFATLVAKEFTARGYAVATISVRSSVDARFPAQGHDVRAAVRWLRENASAYEIDPNRFAFMGDSSGGWAAAFAAATSGIPQLPGEPASATSSAVQVAVPFYPPTDFLSMDTFAAANGLPQGFAYPHDAPTSPEGFLIQCPGEPAPVFPRAPAANPGLVSMQACPGATKAADPATYIHGNGVPIWILHGGLDPLVPYNQSLNIYQASVVAGNEVRFTFVPSAVHDLRTIIGAAEATTRIHNRGGQERIVEGSGPTWDDIEHFLHVNLSRARGHESGR